MTSPGETPDEPGTRRMPTVPVSLSSGWQKNTCASCRTPMTSHSPTTT